MVADVQKSMDFYTAMGFTNNVQFSDEEGKCMVWSDNIYLMIMSLEKFEKFTTRPIADTKTHIAGIFSLSVDGVDEINTIVDNAVKAGGTEIKELVDYGFMQYRTVEDPDGHTWEVFYMDMSKIPQNQEQ